MGFLREKQQAQPMSYDMTGMMNDAGVSDGSGNFLAQVADTAPENTAPVTVPAGPTPKRVSTLDIIGAILDEGAKFGDAAPGYQTAVDRRRTLEQEAQDRSFQQQFNQQKLTAGQLGIDGTKEEMDNARSDRQFTRFGQASRGLGAVYMKHGVAGVQKAFPLLAKSMGMTPQESEIFGQSLAADPEGTIETITAATTADNAGSQPKEKVISDLLLRADPSGKMRDEYLGNLASGLSGYQEGQLGLGSDKITSAERIARIRADASVRAARIRAAASGNKPDAKAQAAAASRVQAAQAAKTVTAEMRNAFTRLRDAGGMNSSDQSVVGRVGAIAKENVPFLERVTSPEGFSAREDLDRLRTVGITSLLPLLGSLTLGGKNFDAAKELEIWRKAIASATDYESATRALDGIDKRIAEITAEQAAPAAASGGSTRPRIRLKPRGNSAPAAGRVFKYNPKTGNLE